jgi:glycosyltransferase involved in cell wall biosynthesis
MKISIVTINKNNANGLLKTVESVCMQTYADIQYIVIDGASTDQSLKVIEPFQNQISYMVSELDSGIYEAMNKGLQHADGNYVLFLNSGDVLCDNAVIANAASYLSGYDLIYGNMILSNKRDVIRKQPDKLSLRHLLRDTIWHPTTFYRTVLIKECQGYNTKLKIAADYDLLLRLVFINHAAIRHIDLAVAVFDVSGLSSLPQSKSLLMNERYIAQRRNMPFYVWLPYQLYSKLSI